MGHVKYAKYYSFAKERTKKDLEEMKKVRTWRVKLRNINYRNYGKMADFFVVFNFGWNFRLTKKAVVVKESSLGKKGKAEHSGKSLPKQKAKKSKSKKKSNKDRRDKPRLQRVIEAVNSRRAFEWESHGTRGRSVLTQVQRRTDNGSVANFRDSFDFKWRGSYLELYTKKLHVEVWDWNDLRPNEFLAVAEQPLKQICSGNMNLKWPIKTETRDRGKKKLLHLGDLDFQCVAQEVLTYTVKLQNWGATLRPKVFNDFEDEFAESKILPSGTFNLHSRFPLKQRGRRRRSKAKKVITVNAASDEIETNLVQMRPLRFRGTRLDLEDGQLFVDVYDNEILFKTLMGSAVIPLKNVVANSFLSSDLVYSGKLSSVLGYLETPIFLSRLGVPDLPKPSSHLKKKSGTVSGSLDIDAEGASLWREFAQKGELQPPELRDFAPFYQSYLAIKIKNCRDLIAADSTGLSDPYVTVAWADQRQETSVIMETLNPIWDETLYFPIRAFDNKKIQREELMKSPVVNIAVWDWDDTGSSDLLGTAKFYLHQITGCIKEEGGLANESHTPQRISIRRPKRLGKALKDVDIHTRVFDSELRLEGLARGVDSYISLEAYFRSPGEGDIVETDVKRRQTDGELLVLPDLERTEQEILLECLCFPFDTANNVKGQRRVCQAVKENTGPCETLQKVFSKIKDDPELTERVTRFEDDMLCRNFFASNQHHQRHFLPTFLQPMTPPTAMLAPDEKKYLVIRSSKMQNSCFKVAKLVRAIEFQDENKLLEGSLARSDGNFCTSDFLLTMRKGDIKAHVMLLCNLFLGLQTDAFICLGYARLEDKNPRTQLPPGDDYEPNEPGEEIPYCWVMTRESDSSACGKAFASAELRDDRYNGAVKFWEVTQAAYFPPLPFRWKGQNDEDEFRKALNKTKKKPSRKSRLDREKDAAKGRGDGVDLETALYRLADEPVEEVINEEDLISGFEQDQIVGQDDIFVSPDFGNEFQVGGLGFGDQPFADFPLENSKRRTSFGHYDDENKNDHNKNKNANRGVGSSQSKEEKEKYDAARDLDHKMMDHILMLNDLAAQAREKKNKTGKPDSRMPFTKLVAIFNNKNVWVNTKPETDPRQLTYQMEDGLATGWLPIIQENQESASAVRPHYPLRVLGPPQTEEKVVALQRAVLDEVQDGIVHYRLSHNVRTRFVPRDRAKAMEKVLDLKHALDMTDKIAKNGWNSRTSKWEGSLSDGKTRSDRFKSSLRKLKVSVPPGYKFRIGFVTVNSSDPKMVRKFVMRHQTESAHARSEVPLHEVNCGGDEAFAVAVKVIPWHNLNCSVMVLCMVVFPDPALKRSSHTDSSSIEQTKSIISAAASQYQFD